MSTRAKEAESSTVRAESPGVATPSVLQICIKTTAQDESVGYKFGYRHQFGLITDIYAKLLMGGHLWASDITLDFAYLS
jgi:hypothetical protein